MEYPSACHSVPAEFLRHCAELGVTDQTIIAHLDADSFYAEVDDPARHHRLARALAKNQAYPVEDIRGILSMFDIEPERVRPLLANGLTGPTARRYAQRGVGIENLERTIRHSLDLAVLDELIEEAKLSFRTTAVLMANQVPAEYIRQCKPIRHVSDEAYRLFSVWAAGEHSEYPEEYLAEMFLGEL